MSAIFYLLIAKKKKKGKRILFPNFPNFEKEFEFRGNKNFAISMIHPSLVTARNFTTNEGILFIVVDKFGKWLMHVSIRAAVFMAEFYASGTVAYSRAEFTRSSELTGFTGGRRALFYELSKKGGQRFLTRDRPLYPIRYFHLSR